MYFGFTRFQAFIFTLLPFLLLLKFAPKLFLRIFHLFLLIFEKKYGCFLCVTFLPIFYSASLAAFHNQCHFCTIKCGYSFFCWLSIFCFAKFFFWKSWHQFIFGKKIIDMLSCWANLSFPAKKASQYAVMNFYRIQKMFSV